MGITARAAGIQGIWGCQTDCLPALGARIASMCWESFFTLSLSRHPQPHPVLPRTPKPSSPHTGMHAG